MKTKILFVEDDINLGFVTKDNLEMQGYLITHCEDGAAAWESFQQNTFDLCILDVMLPKLDGFSLAEKIRAKNQQIPILFLTAKSLKEDRIKGLKIGADDYLTKPFSIEELCLKIEVFLRRSQVSGANNPPQTQGNFRIGAYEFDFNDLLLRHPQEERRLTLREAELLRFFCLRQNELLKREDILIAVWGDDDYFNGRSLDVFISRLRKYLKHDEKIKIENVHGVGFKLLISQ